MRILVTHVLMVAIVGSGAGLGYLWKPGRDVWHAPKAIVPDSNTFAANKVELALADAVQLRETIDRPLFAETRRPPPPPVVQKRVEPDPLRDVKIQGLILVGESGGVAIVGNNGKTQRIKVGQHMGSWTLESIERKKAIFARGKTEKREFILMHLAQIAPRAPAPGNGPVAGNGNPTPGQDNFGPVAPGATPGPDANPGQSRSSGPVGPAGAANPAEMTPRMKAYLEFQKRNAAAPQDASK